MLTDGSDVPVPVSVKMARSPRSKARLKFLISDWGVERFRSVLQERLGFLLEETGPFEEPEDAYIPFGWNAALELPSAGNNNGWKPEDIKTYQDYLGSENTWIQMWVELPDAAW